MKKLAVFLCLAALAFGAFAEDIVLTPTQAVIDVLAALGVDDAELAGAQSRAPADALFLAPGVLSNATVAKINLLATTIGDDEEIEDGTDPKTILDSVIMGELIKARPADFFGVMKMTVGGITWSVDWEPEDD